MHGKISQLTRQSSGAIRPRVVIAGAGFGGLSAAKVLAGANVDVTIVDRQNYHLFQPLLYQVATAGLSPNQIAPFHRSENWFLPIPATFIVGRDGLIRERFVDPDYRKRMDVEQLFRGLGA